MSEPARKIFAQAEGQAAAPIHRIDEPPLLSATTFLVAATKAVGFRWFPLINPETGGISAFTDCTEEIPASKEPCRKCNGSGEEPVGGGRLGQCEACRGYGVTAGGGVTIRRSVTWLFLAEHEGRSINGEKYSPGKFWERMADEGWLALHPNTVIATLARAWRLRGECKPSVRLAAIEAELLAKLPEGLNRETLAQALAVYRGLCWKLQAKEPHPVYGEPLGRHLLIRQGRSKAYIPMDYTPAQRAAKLAEYGMA